MQRQRYTQERKIPPAVYEANYYSNHKASSK